MVSPYLKRPVRSLDEVLRTKPGSQRIDAVIAHILSDAEASGEEQPDQVSRAAEALRRLYPGLNARDALALVRQITAKR